MPHVMSRMFHVKQSVRGLAACNLSARPASFELRRRVLGAGHAARGVGVHTGVVSVTIFVVAASQPELKNGYAVVGCEERCQTSY